MYAIGPVNYGPVNSWAVRSFVRSFVRESVTLLEVKVTANGHCVIWQGGGGAPPGLEIGVRVTMVAMPGVDG